jgi:hypothetical protein
MPPLWMGEDITCRGNIQRGTYLQAELKPYVVETKDGPVEVADLFFADGTTARSVPFKAFSFDRFYPAPEPDR